MTDDPLPIVIDERGLPRLQPTRLGQDAEPWPESYLLLAAARERPGGGTAIAGRYVFMGPGGHERAEGGFCGPAAPAGLLVPGEGPTRSLDDVLERFVFKCCYRRTRAAIVGFGLAEALMSLQRPWVDKRGVERLTTSTRGRIRLWPFLHLDNEGMPRRKVFRPGIEITPRGHGAALYGFTPRAMADAKDLEDLTPPAGVRRDPALLAGRSLKELLKAGYVHPTGRFLDLATGAYVHSGEEGLTLRAACRLFGVARPPDGEALESLAERIAAMEALYLAVLAEFVRWPGVPWLAPDGALTPSSLGKALRRAAGVPQPMRREDRGPRKALAAAMATAGIGSRAETRIRAVSLPGLYTDGHSMYPGLDHVARAGDLFTHEITVRYVTGRRGLEELCDLLAGCTTETLLANPELWPRIRFVARILPEGQLLPIRGEFARNHVATATVPLAAGSEPCWVTGFDLALSAARSDRPPAIIEAWVWETGHPLSGLRPVRLLDGWTYDPGGSLPPGSRVRGDLGLLLAEARMLDKTDPALTGPARTRRRGSLRTVANGAVYGDPVQFDPSGGGTRRFIVDTPDGPITTRGRPERPGPFSYPPAGAFVVGASRLALGLFLHLIERAGGCWCWCDTDGVFVVATPEGGMVSGRDGREYPALSYERFWEIRSRFAVLAAASGLPIPAERLVRAEGGAFKVLAGGAGAAASLFKIEAHNFEPVSSTRLAPGLESFALSQKRYRLGRRDEYGRLVLDPRSKPSRHGLGNFENPSGLSPKAFAEACHLFMIGLVEGDDDTERPEWLSAPVVYPFRVARPDDIERLTKIVPGLRPFDLLLRTSPEWGSGSLVVPYDPDPGAWLRLGWLDTETRALRRITTVSPWEEAGNLASIIDRPAFVQSIEDYLRTYLNTVDVAMRGAGAGGRALLRGSRGPLEPRAARIVGRRVTGKESWRIEERRAGWESPEGSRQIFAEDPGHWQRVLEVLSGLGEVGLHEIGFASRTLRDLRAGASPTAGTRRSAEAAAAHVARGAVGMTLPRGASTDALLVRALETRCCGCGCGGVLPAGRTDRLYLNNAHRMRASRRTQSAPGNRQIRKEH